ncbi:MAG: hypothetical protein MUF54_15530 [Polyangiaceae bacterium]|nr:hypothetical protein [Polyangiaceae bacterium]
MTKPFVPVPDDVQARLKQMSVEFAQKVVGILHKEVTDFATELAAPARSSGSWWTPAERPARSARAKTATTSA